MTRLLLLALALAGSACVTRETFYLDVLGVVADAASAAPLADVEVRSREASTRTDGSGRYRLRVARGLRELTYAAPGRAPVRKFVVVRERREGKADITLDVLVPAEGGGRRKRLVVQRGYQTDSKAKGLTLEAGDATMVAVTDDLGNDDEAVPLGLPERVYGPVWAPGNDEAIFYNVTTPGKTTETRFDLVGVHRYSFTAKTGSRVWGGKGRDTRMVALAAGGDAFVACTVDTAYLVDLATQQTTVMYSRPDPAAPPVTVLGTSWAPDNSIHLAVDEGRGAGRFEARIARFRPPGHTGLTPDPATVTSTTEYFLHPLPLPDGNARLLYAYVDRNNGARRGIRLREDDGTSRELVAGGWQPVALEGDVLLYIQNDNLHRRNLTTGHHVVIAQGTEWAAWR